MYVTVSSEIDSRVVVYPLMRTLMRYGTILVISSNRQLRRLIDDLQYSTFRNMTVIVDENGATDDIYSEWGVAPGDFDFVILDNVGSLDFNKGIILLGNKQSPEFMEELEMLKQQANSSKYTIIDFGVREKDTSASDNKERPKRENSKRSVNVVPEDYDPASKFRERLPEDLKKEKEIKTFKAKLPTFDDIEKVEGNHRFYNVGEDLIKVFYEILKDELAVPFDKFRKEVHVRDESSHSRK